MMRKKNMLPVFVGTALAALVYVSYRAGLMDVLELKSLDRRFQMRGSIPPTAPIVLVSIDHDSFAELNLPWPWPRDLHAALIRKLAKAGAKIIAFDVLFTEPKADAREDQQLASAIKEAGNVVLAAEITDVVTNFGPSQSVKAPIPLIREHGLGWGLANLLTDVDSLVRRARAAFSFQDQTYLSFPYQIYQNWTGRRSPRENVSSAPFLINFRGPAGTFLTVPYHRILRDELNPSIYRDKIILIGAFAPSLHDDFPTPFPGPTQMAGVEIHANVIDTLLANDPIVPFPLWWHAFIFVVLCALTIWLSIRLSPLKAFTVVFALTGIYVFGCYYLFSGYRLNVPLTPTVLGVVVTYGGLTLDNYIREQRERIRTRAFLNKYVSSDVAAEILEDREGLGLGGKRRHITVLFSDLRGFTSISEQIGPEQVVSLLSDYFAHVTEIIFNHGGTVDKFMGDGVMAIFGAPRSHGDDAARAIKTGLALIDMVESLGPKWSGSIGRPLKVGVGINSGDAVVGSIGSEMRSDFTAIGDTVNLASRLEALTKELEVPILVSEFTAAELKDDILLKPLQRVKVQGREAPLLVYTSAAHVDGQVNTALDTTEPYVQRHK